jgi:mannose-6-phosphate isomerase-like protein (cupin superfamily)
VARRRSFAEGLSLLENPHQRGPHPKRGAHHGHRQDVARRGALRRHRHRQAEVYLVLEGTGSVGIGPEARPVEAGSAVFIPGNAFHSLANTGASELRFAYVFAADSFEEIEYVFDE